MARLHELLARERDHVLRCFQARVSNAGLMPPGSPPSQIVDDVPRILDGIVASLAACDSDAAVPSDERRAAREHGQHRRALAIDLASVVREYALLRDCILDVARARGETPSIDEVQCLTACLDVAIDEAIDEYTAHRDSEVVRERAGLEAERLRLRTAIALLPVAVMITDADGRAFEANDAMRALWGARGGPFPAERLSEAFPGRRPDTQEPIPHAELPLHRALRAGETCLNEPIEIDAADGSRKTILASSAPTRDDRGAITGAVVVHVDISAQAAALKESQLAVKTREEILAVVAHDLKNPLNAIHIAASRLERGVDEAAVRTMGATVNRAAKRMDRLVTDLLELAQLEAGHLVLQREPVDLRVLVREALEHVRPLAQAKNVWLEKERLDASPIVDCDRERIHQVLANLLGNAVKFTPEGGSIFVRLSFEEPRVVFEVADTGPGIAPAALPHVFDRFWQSPGGHTGGQGLGLAIARGIVEAHGGEIWARSAPGTGSSFFFSLPLTDASSSSRWAVSRA